MKQARTITSAALIVLASLVLTVLPARGDAQGRLPVAVVPNIGDVEDVSRVVFSPNEKLAATVNGYSGSSVGLWDIASGRPLRALNHAAFFTAVAFSPNGTLIASAHKDGKVKLWDVATGANTATFSSGSKPRQGEDPGEAWSVAIDAKGELLVSGDNAGVVTVWDIAQRKRINSFALDRIPDDDMIPRVLAVRMSADRSRLIALTRKLVGVFDVGTGKAIASFILPDKPGPDGSRERYAFAADSIVGDDEFVVRFSAADCKIDALMLVSLKDTNNFVSVDKPATCEPKDDDSSYVHGEPTVFADPGQPNLVIARVGFPELTVWDLQTRRAARTIKGPDAAGARVLGLARDFRSAATLDGQTLRIRDVESGAAVGALTAYGCCAENAVVAKDGRSIMLSYGRSGAQPKQKDLTLWRVDQLSPKTVRLPAGSTADVRDFAPGPMIALGVEANGDIVLFSTETGAERRRFSVAGINDESRARLSPDGKTIAAIRKDRNNEGEIEKSVAVLIGAEDGAVRLTAAGRSHEDNVTSVAFSADGTRVAVGRRNGTAEIWSTQQAKRIVLLPADKKIDDPDTWSLAFSADGRRLIGSGLFDEAVHLWNVATARLVRTFEMDAGRAGYRHAASVAVSRDGKLVAGGLAQRAVSSGDIGPERGGIMVWDTATGKLRFTLRGHEGAVLALTFSPDDRWIISGSLDGTIRYWDRASGTWMATFAATRDGRWMVVTQAGFYAGSPGVDDLINVVRGLETRPVARLREHLYRPDLVEQLLKGDPQHRYRRAARGLDLAKLWDAARSP